MKTALTLVTVAAALAASACSDSERARTGASWDDRPADIACWSHGTQTFAGQSTGKIEYDDGGRLSFVDAATNRYTTIDGDCRVVYLPEADGGQAPPAA